MWLRKNYNKRIWSNKILLSPAESLVASTLRRTLVQLDYEGAFIVEKIGEKIEATLRYLQVATRDLLKVSGALDHLKIE